MEEVQPNPDGIDPRQELSTDERAIELGIQAARDEDREVDDATARRVASQLHGGQSSALYSLASIGNLADERLEAELYELYQSRNPRILEWASVLGTCALYREHKGPVDGWAELTADERSVDGNLGSLALEAAEPSYEEANQEAPPPQIWVGSLSDYNAGRLHGEWIDADQAPEDLHAAVRQILERSPTVGAEEWAVMDYDGFYGLGLGEYESMETVSRIARGIAEHGEAFARWVGYVGVQNEEEFDRFEECYQGHFDSTEDYVEQLLEDSGDERCLEDLPEHLKPYVRIDTDAMARDFEIDLYVVEASDGGVWVFDPGS